MDEKMLIDAICAFFGCTVKDAKIYMKNSDTSAHSAIIAWYIHQTKKAFCND